MIWLYIGIAIPIVVVVFYFIFEKKLDLQYVWNYYVVNACGLGMLVIVLGCFVSSIVLSHTAVGVKYQESYHQTLYPLDSTSDTYFKKTSVSFLGISDTYYTYLIKEDDEIIPEDLNVSETKVKITDEPIPYIEVIKYNAQVKKWIFHPSLIETTYVIHIPEKDLWTLQLVSQ